MRVRIYDCIYGMELFKPYFANAEAENRCLLDIAEYYSSFHEKGAMVGPMNVNNIIIDTETGSVDFPPPESIETLLNSIDTLKYLPPEIINGSLSWGIKEDMFCLALILFSVRYYGHPFDGAMLYESPLVNINTAGKLYGKPRFIFDTADMSNSVLEMTHGRIIRRWNEESNIRLKDYFIQKFAGETVNDNMKVSARELTDIILNRKSVHVEDGNVRFMEAGGKRIKLTYGTEIYERDLNDVSETDNKLGMVVRNIKNERMPELVNVSKDTWSVYLPDSKEIMVPPNGAAPLVKGAIISIGEHLVNIV